MSENLDQDYLGADEEEIYKENILDHHKDPHNVGKLDKCTHHDIENNPLCGDKIEVFINIKDNKIEDIKFIGHGCAISQASMSMLTDIVKGKTIDEIKALTKDDVTTMLGIKLGAVRLKCALLSLKTISKAIENNDGK